MIIEHLTPENQVRLDYPACYQPESFNKQHFKRHFLLIHLTFFSFYPYIQNWGLWSYCFYRRIMKYRRIHPLWYWINLLQSKLKNGRGWFWLCMRRLIFARDCRRGKIITCWWTSTMEAPLPSITWRHKKKSYCISLQVQKHVNWWRSRILNINLNRSSYR